MEILKDEGLMKIEGGISVNYGPSYTGPRDQEAIWRRREEELMKKISELLTKKN